MNWEVSANPSPSRSCETSLPFSSFYTSPVRSLPFPFSPSTRNSPPWTVRVCEYCAKQTTSLPNPTLPILYLFHPLLSLLSPLRRYFSLYPHVIPNRLNSTSMLSVILSLNYLSLHSARPFVCGLQTLPLSDFGSLLQLFLDLIVSNRKLVVFSSWLICFISKTWSAVVTFFLRVDSPLGSRLACSTSRYVKENGIGTVKPSDLSPPSSPPMVAPRCQIGCSS